MTDQKDIGIKAKSASINIQIPLFYKMMVSMLFVAMLPIVLLGIVTIGGTGSIVSMIGVQSSIFVITLITLTVIMMWSFFLASRITNPIVTLSQIATNISKGEVKTAEIEFMSNDEIGELVMAFNKMINTYRILDTLAKEEVE
jgi:signal transduction histidine kinase